MTETLQRSRLADSPSSRIDAEATALAAQAEITLLRKLLSRCDNYLAAVVQEARIDGGLTTMLRGCGGTSRSRCRDRLMWTPTPTAA